MKTEFVGPKFLLISEVLVFRYEICMKNTNHVNSKIVKIKIIVQATYQH